MAEIAEDCDMSAANIYRFFESKNDIVAEIASGCFRQIEDSLREIVHRQGLTAGERLETFILKMLHSTHDLYANQPKINESVEFITNERFDLITRHKEVKQSLIAEILAEGNRDGKFDMQDIVTTAELVLKATVFFYWPAFMNIYPLEKMEQIARGVVSLLVRGLEKR